MASNTLQMREIVICMVVWRLAIGLLYPAIKRNCN